MSVNIIELESADKKRVRYTLEWGRGKGERKATGLFTYKKPQDSVQKNHNAEMLRILSIKQSNMTIEKAALTTPGVIPAHKLKNNFLDFVEDFEKSHSRTVKSRTMSCAVGQFKLFVGTNFIPRERITESYCTEFRDYLLRELNGETPKDYFGSFKRIIKQATKENYFSFNPAEDVVAKCGKNFQVKEHLEAEEYIKLLKAPCLNYLVKEGFVFSCYTGIRFIDLEGLTWDDYVGDEVTFRLIQTKTGEPLTVTLHPIAKAILDRRKEKKEYETKAFGKVYKPNVIFNLPTHDGSNKVVKKWVKEAGVDKKITWHCARKSFSVLLQDEKVDIVTVSILLGHKSPKHAMETYRRARPKNQMETIQKLPSPDNQPEISDSKVTIVDNDLSICVVEPKKKKHSMQEVIGFKNEMKEIGYSDERIREMIDEQLA